MSKTKCVIYAPISSYSGYGAASRDKCKALIELYGDEWDIKIMSCGWGNLPITFIEDHEDWKWIEKYIMDDGLTEQPDIMIYMTIPTESRPIGRWNCLFTAGIETNICAPQWIESINQLDLTIVPSTHSKDVFERSSFDKKDKNTGQVVSKISLQKKVEVVFEGFNEDIYKKTKVSEDSIINKELKNIPESFNFLFTGMWLQGDFNEDRKNISGLIKVFFETFKNKPKQPGLILKTSSGPTSILDREKIRKKIDKIASTVKGKNLPNVYILQGDMKDNEINELYNHPKIKCMISLTKGEGFGRPLLEFTQSKKPIICSGWGGQIDFLNKDFTNLVPGTLQEIHPSAQIKDMLIPGSSWFNFNADYASAFMRDIFENNKKYKEQGNRLSYYCKENFSYNKMKERLKIVMDENIKLPYKLKMPKLQKIK